MSKKMYDKNSILHLRITELDQITQIKRDLRTKRLFSKAFERTLKNFVTFMNIWEKKNSDYLNDEIKKTIKHGKEKLKKVKKKLHDLKQFFLVLKKAEKDTKIRVEFWLQKSDEYILKKLNEPSSNSILIFPQHVLFETLKCYKMYYYLEIADVSFEILQFQKELNNLKKKSENDLFNSIFNNIQVKDK